MRPSARGGPIRPRFGLARRLVLAILGLGRVALVALAAALGQPPPPVPRHEDVAAEVDRRDAPP